MKFSEFNLFALVMLKLFAEVHVHDCKYMYIIRELVGLF